MQKLSPEQRLPLIDLAMPALRELSFEQYQRFKQNLNDLLHADRKIDLFEWTLQKVVLHHLDDAFIKQPPRPVKHKKLSSVQRECMRVIALLAYAGHKAPNDIEKAFGEGCKILGFNNAKLLPKKDIKLESLNKAIHELAMLAPLAKPQLLKACVACVISDGQVTTRESELLRAFSSVIDCPLPPINLQSRSGC